MQIQLIQGEFNVKDALELMTQMIHLKIRFHENKISQSNHEEDIKFREAKIKRLQKELYELKENLDKNSKKIKVQGTIQID